MVSNKITHIIFLYSCKKYKESRLDIQMETWPKRVIEKYPNVLLLPITGDGNNTINNGILELAVGDGYCDLIDKTQTLFDWFINNTTAEYLIKVDDDVWLHDNFIEILLNDNHHYSGLLRYKHWFGGPIYKLSRHAILAMPRLRTMIDPTSDKAHCYPEDRAVGEAMHQTALNDFYCLLAIPFNSVCVWRHNREYESKYYDFMFVITRQKILEMFTFAESIYLAGIEKKELILV